MWLVSSGKRLRILKLVRAELLVDHLPNNFVGGHDEAELVPVISTEDPKATETCWTGLLLFLSIFEVDFPPHEKREEKKKSEGVTCDVVILSAICTT